MLPLLALTSAALFFLLLRMGILDDLPNLLKGPRGSPKRRPRRLLSDRKEMEEAKRLEVFKDFLEGDSEAEK